MDSGWRVAGVTSDFREVWGPRRTCGLEGVLATRAGFVERRSPSLRQRVRSTPGEPFLTWCRFPAKVTASGWRDPGGVQVVYGELNLWGLRLLQW